MALEPITRQEKIIAGQDLTPITRMEKFLKQYGGGSGGVTSWNDLTDKPFGEVTTVKEVLAECQPEYVPEIEEGLSGFVVYATRPDTVVLGETYIVNYNGVDYPCVATGKATRKVVDPANSVVILGNLGAVTGGTDTGEPFAISWGVSQMLIVPLDGSTTLTISIRQEVTEVKKISGKYVEGMGYEEDGVVHPIDPKFPPSGGGGVIFTMTDTGYTCNVTYAEADERLRNGASAFIQMFRNTLELVVSGQRLTAIKVEWYLGVSVPYMKLYFEPAPNATMSLTYKEDNTITEEE